MRYLCNLLYFSIILDVHVRSFPSCAPGVHVHYTCIHNYTLSILYAQNENGPCPLLALCNVLILSGRIKIPAGETVVTSTHLVDLLGACLIESRCDAQLTPGERANYEQNIQDAMAVFPNLQTGLDVNVKFNRYEKNY